MTQVYSWLYDVGLYIFWLIQFLLVDEIVLPLFQVYLLIVFVIAFRRQYRKNTMGIGMVVNRTEKSMENFELAFAIASGILVLVIDSSEAYTGYKTIVALADLTALIYLSHYYWWSRNKIMGIMKKCKIKKRDLHRTSSPITNVLILLYRSTLSIIKCIINDRARTI